MENPRVSDAACLAAFEKCEHSAVEVMVTPTHIVIIDNAAPVGMREVSRFKMEDAEAAQTAYRIAFFRPILEAALNIQ